MANELTPGLGSKIYIGPVATTADDLTEFDAVTAGDWDEIGLVENLAEFGTKWETGSFTPVGDGRKRKFKTTKDNGSLPLVCAFKADDAGQIAAAAAAEDQQNSYPIKVILNDDTGLTGSKPTRYYFYAYVTSATVNPGGAGDTVRRSFGLELDSDVVAGAAVAGS
jgi:hypothetical protein